MSQQNTVKGLFICGNARIGEEAPVHTPGQFVRICIGPGQFQEFTVVKIITEEQAKRLAPKDHAMIRERFRQYPASAIEWVEIEMECPASEGPQITSLASLN